MVSFKLRITQRVLIKLFGTQTKNREKRVLGIWGSFMGRKGWEKIASKMHSIYDIGEEQNLLIKNLNTSNI